MQDQIQYVKRKDIDAQKWDDCIRQSPNGIIYAYSFYLDSMCDQWDALILGDYEIIMPLPWKKKYGIRYLYQPYFTQQSGIFSRKEIPASMIDAFLTTIKSYFKFAEIHLNYGNYGFENAQLNNFILSLNRPYPEIYSSYKNDLKKNLLRASKFQLIYQSSKNYKSAIFLFRKAYSMRLKMVKPMHYLRLENLCRMANEKGMILVREIRNTGNEVLASALCLKDDKRIYLLLSTTSSLGKKYEANHFLLDSLIREFHSNDLLLDFEGSDVPGIAHFYKNFGSLNQSYYFFHYNNLPWPLRLFKRKT